MRVPTPELAPWGVRGVAWYSALNHDALRLARMHQLQHAKRLSNRAERLETSAAAEELKGWMQHAALQLAQALQGQREPIGSWSRLDSAHRRPNNDIARTALGTDVGVQSDVVRWLTSVSAWHDEIPKDHGTELLLEACHELSVARDRLVPRSYAATTYSGLVRRLNLDWAEIESESGSTIRVQRRAVESEGLAAPGQPVSLLIDDDGTPLVFAAVMLQGDDEAAARPVWPDEGSVELTPADIAFIADTRVQRPFRFKPVRVPK